MAFFPLRNGRAKRLGSAGLAALAMGLATSVVAQTEPNPIATPPATIRLGAGEHDGFSRVVLNMTPPSGWRSRMVEGGVEIELPGPTIRFNDVAIAKQRRAHRVSSTEARRTSDATILKIDFGCACQADVYAMKGAMIVVDVRNRDRSAPEAVAVQTEPAPRPVVQAAEALTSKPAESSTPNAVAETAPAATSAAPAVAEPEPKPQEASAPKPPTPPRAASPKQEMEAEVAKAREMLLKQLQRAADQGFVQFQDAPAPAGSTAEAQAPTPAEETADASPDEPHDGAAEMQTADPTRPAAAADATADAMTPQAPKPEPSAKPARQDEADPARTAHFERRPAAAVELEPEPARPALPEPDCPTETALSPEYWIDDRPFHEGLAARRAAMFDGLNRIDAEAAREMVGFYLGHGLGAEAALMAKAFSRGRSDFGIARRRRPHPRWRQARQALAVPAPHAMRRPCSALASCCACRH